MHPAHFGVQSCRKAIQLMRAKHFLNAVQRAGEHRRVLVAGVSFLIVKLIIYNKMNTYEITFLHTDGTTRTVEIEAYYIVTGKQIGRAHV